MAILGPDGKPARRNDGLHNVLTRLGDINRDKSENTTFQPNPEFSAFTLDALYEHDAIAARIIDRPADDLVREGFTLEDIDDVDLPAIESLLEELGRNEIGEPTHVLTNVADLYRWGHKDAGALLVAAVDDGRLPREPMELDAIQRVRGFFVLDKNEVTPLTIGNGPPEAYMINATTDVAIEDTIIHASRVRKFVGIKVSRRRQRERSWWGVPKLQRVWSRLRQYFSALGYSENLLHDAVLDVFKLAGFAEQLMQEGGEELALQRLLNLKLGQDILHGTVLDAEDDYMAVTKSAGTGIPELLDRFVSALVAATDMPRSILLGETPGGLNTGENAGEIRSWYDAIRIEQNQKATPWINWILTILFSSREGPTNGNVPDGWTVRWNPLWQPTEKEQADVRKVNADTDNIMVTMGAAAVEEVRESRMRQGSTGHLEAMEEFDDLSERAPEPAPAPEPEPGDDEDEPEDELLDEDDETVE